MPESEIDKLRLEITEIAGKIRVAYGHEVKATLRFITRWLYEAATLFILASLGFLLLHYVA